MIKEKQLPALSSRLFQVKRESGESPEQSCYCICILDKSEDLLKVAAIYYTLW